eukprot:PhM_4_TR1099/c0_g2_i1/m.38226
MSPSSSILIVEPALCLVVVALCLAGRFAAHRWSRVAPKIFFPNEIKLRKAIAAKHREREALNNPSSFAQCAKIERLLMQLEGDLHKLVSQRQEERGELIFVKAPTVVLRYFAWVPLYVLYGGMTLFVVDLALFSCLMHRFMCVSTEDWDLGVVPLLLITTVAAKYAMK